MKKFQNLLKKALALSQMQNSKLKSYAATPDNSQMTQNSFMQELLINFEQSLRYLWPFPS